MKKADHFLEVFFSPRSIAVIGATNNEIKMNYRLMENLTKLGYKGKLYPVNPSAKEVLGAKAYSRLNHIPDKIDLVVSAVPAAVTPTVVEDCHEIGVKSLVIISGGFSEGGKEGQERHDKMEKFIKEKGIRTLGPNTLSPANTEIDMIISFNPVKEMRQGNISFAFQSGFYEPKLNWIFSHLGVSKMLDMGNKLDINEVDALDYFSQDSSTEIVAMHIESVHGDGNDFINSLKSLAAKKPTIVLKSGRTKTGSKAAASHTGSMANENDAIFDGILKQAGALRAHNLDDFFDLAKAFQFLPLPEGNRIGIICLSGGEGVMATDYCELNGMELSKPAKETHDKLKPIFPPWDVPLNPFDAGVCMEFNLTNMAEFISKLFAIFEDENTDSVIIQMPPYHFSEMFTNKNLPEKVRSQLLTQLTKWLSQLRNSNKPFAFWSTSNCPADIELIDLFEKHQLPVFSTSERAVKAIAALYRFSQRKRNQ